MSVLLRTHRRRPSGSGLAVALAVLAAVVALLGIAVRGEAAPQTRAQVAHQIASGLRCPVCQDLSAADSPAPIARQMRVQIGQKLAAGDSPAEIRDSFVAAYGNSVLMMPPKQGIASAAYVFPFAVLALAVLAAGLLLRRSLSRPPPAPATARDPQEEA
jgi:cytochrome c-type biogenesis protein CcmH